MGDAVKDRTGGRAIGLIAAALALCVALGGVAFAAKYNGTKRGERVLGTKKADRINGKGGNDILKGRGGNDTLKGGKGRDKVNGGPGKDRHLGGPGADVLKAADGRRDKAINGGPGNDRCVVDTARELSLVRGCETVNAGSGGGGGGGGPAPGLTLNGVSGLVCASPLPACVFSASGEGADAPVGTVTGGGGVVALGAGVAITGSAWTATGLYGCTADGFLRITIGSETVDAPVDCTI